MRLLDWLAGHLDGGRRASTARARTLPLLEALESRAVPAMFADFNGDGFDDLAVAMPWAVDGSGYYGGAVQVIYGSATGLSAAGPQRLGQAGLGFSSTTGDEFGAPTRTIASGRACDGGRGVSAGRYGGTPMCDRVGFG